MARMNERLRKLEATRPAANDREVVAWIAADGVLKNRSTGETMTEEEREERYAGRNVLHIVRQLVRPEARVQ